MKLSKKILAIVCAVLMMATALTNLCVVSAESYTAESWLIGGEKNVTVNSDGTLNIAQFSNAVLNQPIDLTDPNLDISVKMELPFQNADQMVSVILTKDATDLGLDSANTVAHRFAKDGEKYGLNHSWLGSIAVGLYCGGYTDFSSGKLTVRIKNDNGTIRLYMDDQCIFYGAEHAPIYSDAVTDLGTAYLGIAVSSGNGAISAKILEVNGQNPTGYVPAPSEDYTESDWLVGGENNVKFNADGTINVAQGSTAALKRPINLAAADLDVSVKMAIPFANTAQFVSVILTKDISDLGLESSNTVAHRFALDGEKYGLNQSYLKGSATGNFAGGYIPFSNGQLTVRFKNDNGTIRLYLDDQLVFYLADHAENYSNTVKSLGTAYLGIAVTSFEGPISAQILEVNGKSPVTVPECEHEYAYPCDPICSKCYELTNPDAAHSVKHVEAKEPTCTAEGNIEYWTCEYCGAAWADEACTQVTNLMSVKLGASCKYAAVYNAAKAATCYEEGNVEYWYCANCDVYYADADCTVITNAKNVILPVSHNVKHVEAKEPTCTELGNIEYWYCEDCGSAWLDELCHLNTNLRAVVLPMAEHSYDNDYDVDCNVCGGIRTVEMPITSAGTSISEDVSGLAALFTINVDGLTIKEGTKTVADYSNATVNGYKLIGMGVIASNGIDELTIPAKYLYALDAENGTATYAARIINIPADKYDVEITFRSYFVIEIDGVETTVYGDTVTASYNAVLNG